MPGTDDIQAMIDNLAARREAPVEIDLDKFTRFNDVAYLSLNAVRLFQNERISASECRFLAAIRRYGMLSEKQAAWAQDIETRLMLEDLCNAHLADI